jgi:hypothetical protein
MATPEQIKRRYEEILAEKARSSSAVPTTTEGAKPTPEEIQARYQQIINERNTQETKLPPAQPDTRGFLEKTSDTLESKFLRPVTNTLVSPIARELQRPFVSAIRGIQGLIPGGKDGTESVNTPFGEVKPFSQLSSKEAAMGAIEVGSFLPVEKLFIKPAQFLSKKLKGAATTAGEILTGVEKQKLNSFIDLAKNQPERLETIKKVVKTNPKEPFLGYAEEVAEKINTLKSTAQDSFVTAIDNAKKRAGNATFELENKLPKIKETLNDFRLTVNQLRDNGKFMSKARVSPLTRTSPYTDREVKQIQGLVDKMRVKNMSIDELLDFDDSVKRFLDDALKKDNKKLAALGARLVEDSTQFIDDLLPEVNNANQLYRDYYKLKGTIGKKLLNADGTVKQGAESFLGNLENLNKGATRKEVQELSKILGRDVVADVKDINTVKQLMETVPNTTKNRTIDIIRGVVGSQAFSGAAGAAVLFNPAVAVPALLINIMSSPNVYRGFLEGISSGKPIAEVIKNLPPEEIVAIRKLFSDVFGSPLKQAKDNQPNDNAE